MRIERPDPIHVIPLGRLLLRVAALAIVISVATRAQAKLYLTQEQALRVAFGEAKVERRTAFLSEAQLARARELAGRGVEVVSALVTWYEGSSSGRPTGSAYFDTHRVRTLQETLMVVVKPDGTVGRIEILSFGEPAEYLPKAPWLDQFVGRDLDRELALKRGIHGVTGATLSAGAVTDATRRILAIHRVLHEGAGP